MRKLLPYFAGCRNERLLAAGPAHKLKGRLIHPCFCDCGGITKLYASTWSQGTVKSCGCLRREVTGNLKRIHNQRVGCKNHSSEYSTWANMRSRCSNPNTNQYQDYGGRGIRCCDRWNSFLNFAQDMGPKPTLQHTLDRYPNPDGNYEPSNCRWATRKEQAANKQKVRSLRNFTEDEIRSEFLRRGL